MTKVNSKMHWNVIKNAQKKTQINEITFIVMR